MELVKKCNGCKHEAKCKHIGKILRVTRSVERQGYSVEHLKITVLQQDEFIWRVRRYVSSPQIELDIRCDFLRKKNFQAIRKFLVRSLNDEEMENREAEDRESEEESNFNRAITKLEKSEELRYSVETIQSSEVNGYANDLEQKIYITSAAAETLSEAELAFIISHEEAHLDYDHGIKRRLLLGLSGGALGAALEEIFDDANTGTIRKLVTAGLLSAAVLAGDAFAFKLHELYADVAAKKRMLNAGYSEEEILEFAERYENEDGNLISAHPSWRSRKKVLE